MMENDDKLIEQFLAKNKFELEDNGFSKRVMQQLPYRQNHLSKVLNIITIIAILLLFTLANGWQILWGNLQGFIIAALKTGAIEIEPTTLIATGVILLFVFYHKVLSIE